MNSKPKQGFTILEITIALGILAFVVVIVAQMGFQSMRDRKRNADRHEALELAANILESARACPWNSLSPSWAAEQKLPDFPVERLHEGRLTVRVESAADDPAIKRVTVAIHWLQEDGKAARPVELTALFSTRTAPGKERNP